MATNFGKYTLEKKLGQGGMGAVYLAVDPALNRKVALKIITSDDEEMLERFQREAQAVAKLKHPNIVQVHETGVIAKQHYFTMDYIEGASLEKLIESHTKLNFQNISKIILQIATALDYAHKQQIIHRDVKPANILIDKSGKVYLTDFGLAKQLTGLKKSLTISGTTIGTPYYMPPEQAQGKKQEIDSRSDVYALGATLYHCLAGRVPFSGNELLDVLTKVVNDDPPMPSSVADDIPRDLETICLKCLEKDKSKRYQTATELAIDIKHYLQGEPISGRRTSYLTKLWWKTKKNKKAIIAIASAIALSGAITTGLLISSANTSKKVKDFYSQETTKSKEDEALKSRANAILGRAATVSNLEEKIKIAEEALKTYPQFGEAFQALGYVYKDKKNIEKAFECFSKAVELTPNLAYSYYERALITLYDHNKPEDAITDFEMVLKYDPGSHIGWFARGTVEINQKKYDEAIKSYTKAIELHPNYDVAYNNRSAAYHYKNDLRRAIADLNEAIILNPQYATAYSNRGMAYFEKGDVEQAIVDFNEAIKLDPRRADAYSNRGGAYVKKGDFERAIADLNEAIRLDSRHVSAYSNRGCAYMGKSDFERAIADLNEAIRLDSKRADAYSNRGGAYVKKGDFERAIADLNEAIKLNPKDTKAYSNRGVAYEKKDNLERAIEEYGEAIKLDPKYANAYSNRGNAYNKKGELDKAIIDYNDAIRLNSQYALAYYNRGNAYAKQGKFKPAISDAEMFLKLAPNSQYAAEMKQSIQDWEKKIVK